VRAEALRNEQAGQSQVSSDEISTIFGPGTAVSGMRTSFNAVHVEQTAASSLFKCSQTEHFHEEVTGITVGGDITTGAPEGPGFGQWHAAHSTAFFSL
jgi:hypothetical protein